MSDLKITIEKSPYGDEGKVYSGMLGMINHFRLQLISFRNQDKTPEEREFLEADILGYEKVLETGLEENAQAFMEAKRGKKFIENGYKSLFKNNLEIVEFLKSSSQWKPAAPDKNEEK